MTRNELAIREVISTARGAERCFDKIRQVAFESRVSPPSDALPEPRVQGRLSILILSSENRVRKTDQKYGKPRYERGLPKARPFGRVTLTGILIISRQSRSQITEVQVQLRSLP